MPSPVAADTQTPRQSSDMGSLINKLPLAHKNFKPPWNQPMTTKALFDKTLKKNELSSKGRLNINLHKQLYKSTVDINLYGARDS